MNVLGLCVNLKYHKSNMFYGFTPAHITDEPIIFMEGEYYPIEFFIETVKFPI